MIEEYNQQNIEKYDFKNISIPLELLYPQKYISGRNMKEETSSNNFLQFVEEILEVNGIFHPIIIREDGDGKFEIFAGCRRYEAYKLLVCQGHEEYKKIPARSYPKDTPISFLNQLKKLENDARKDLTKKEKMEFLLSSTPILLELDIIKRNNAKDNLVLGQNILQKYKTYMNDKEFNEKPLKEIQILTGDINVVSKLSNVFQKIRITWEKLYSFTKVYFDVSREILALFRKDIICDRHALGIQSMKSKKDKKEILSKLQKVEVFPYGLLEKYIRDSNAEFSPVKKNKKLIQKVKHVKIQLESDKGADRPEQLNDEIKMNIEKIENIINKGR